MTRLSRGHGGHRRQILAVIKPYWAKIAVVSVVAFLGGSCEAGFLVLITRTGLAVANGDPSFTVRGDLVLGVGAAIGIALGLLTIRVVLALWGVQMGARVSIDARAAYQRRLAGAFLHASWSVQQSEPAGRLQVLVVGFAGYVGNVVGAFVGAAGGVLNLAAMLIVALVVDPVATAVVVVVLGVLGLVLAPIRRRIRLRSKASARVSMDFANSVSELGELGMEMQVFGARDSFINRTGDLIDSAAHASRRATTLQGSLAPIYISLAYTALIGGLGAAAMVGTGQASALGAVLLLMLRSLSYGQQLQAMSGNMINSLPWVEDADVLLGRYESARATSGDIAVDTVGEIRASNVSFSYSPDAPVLRKFEFAIAPGEVVGVIGPSGAGKSTLVQLLLGLRDATEGTITVGGTDLRDVDRDSWSRQVALVPQDAHLLTGTVSENIRFFRDNLTDQDLRSAAISANIAAEIEALPDGYDTHLGERGQRLSGGQRQRLSIARALAGQPRLLILDEPTSALDVRSEMLIRDTVADLHGRVTVVIIAHRMSTLDVCDRLMVVENGELTAFDTPDVLKARSDFYLQALELSGIATNE